MTALGWIAANAARLRAAGPWLLDEGMIRGPASGNPEARSCPLSTPSGIGETGMDVPSMAARHGLETATARLIVDAADGNPGHWADIREALLRAVGLGAPEREAGR